MRKFLCAAVVLCVPWGTPGAHADELTPRYRHVIGVSIGWTGAKEYSCPAENNTLTTYRPVNAQVRGVRVLKVFPGSPAEKSGLACGDVIFSVNGIDVDFPEMMSRTVDKTPKDEALALVVAKPSVAKAEDGVLTASYETFTPLVVRERMSYDRIPEFRARLGRLVYDQMYADTIGPYFRVHTRAQLEEVSPEVFRYSCEIKNSGAQELVPLKSFALVLLPHFSRDEVMPVVSSGSSFTMEYTGRVDVDGMPTEVWLPFSIARQVFMNKTQEFFKSNPEAGVGRLGVSDDNTDWYAWNEVRIPCVLPEKIAQALEKKYHWYGFSF